MDMNYFNPLLDYMDWEGGNGEVNCSLAFMKEIDFLSPTHGLRGLRDDYT
jgi:hypothetical protein